MHEPQFGTMLHNGVLECCDLRVSPALVSIARFVLLPLQKKNKHMSAYTEKYRHGCPTLWRRMGDFMLTVRKSRPDTQASLNRLIASVIQSTLYFSLSFLDSVCLTVSTVMSRLEGIAQDILYWATYWPQLIQFNQVSTDAFELIQTLRYLPETTSHRPG